MSSRSRHGGASARPVVALLATWLFVVAIVVTACADDETQGPVGQADPGRGSRVSGGTTGADGYAATLTRTSHGIAHITAADFGSLGFGQGWAIAEDHGCTVFEQVMTVRSERSRFLGAGDEDEHLDSDVAYLAIGLYRAASARWSSLDPDARSLVDGYAAGVNAWLRTVGPDGFSGWCVGADWVHAITPVDVVAIADDVALHASGAAGLLDAVAAVQPPAAATSAPGGPPGERDAGPRGDPGDDPDAVDRAPGDDGAGDDERRGEPAAGREPGTRSEAAADWSIAPAFGGVAMAIGSDVTGNPGSMLLSTPSGPWTGPMRLWEVQLTIPGRFDVYGATPVGVPGVVLGFSDEVAWSIAPSSAVRLTAYELAIETGQPTMYRFDGGVRPLESEQVAIEVRVRDGATRTERRTLWRSHHGPLVAPTGHPWTAAGAFAVRGLGVDVDVIGFSLALAQAGGLDELRLAAALRGPSPWGATVAAASDGRVLYLDTTAVPALEAVVTSDMTAAATHPAGAAVGDEPDRRPSLVDEFAGVGEGPPLTVLDGSTSQTEWIVDDERALTGRIPFDRAPQHERTDHVVATASGHWLVNPAAPLEGFDPMFGAERTAPAAGDRQALVAMADLVARQAEEPPPTLHEVRDLVFDNRSITGALLRDAVAERCRAAGPVFVTAGRGLDGDRLWVGRELELDAACDALEHWDASFELESRGAVLWREFNASFVSANPTGVGQLFRVSFDPSDPLGTPRGLAPAPVDRPDPVVVALARAVALLESSRVAVDAPIREVQYTDRGDERIPLHGGFSTDGTVQTMATDTALRSSLEPHSAQPLALLDQSWLTRDGYPVRSGTSFVLAVAFGPEGPVAEALLPYGQSGDQMSPFAADQTYRFSDEAWRPVLFRDADLSSDPNRTTQQLRAPRAGG